MGGCVSPRQVEQNYLRMLPLACPRGSLMRFFNGSVQSISVDNYLFSGLNMTCER